MKLWRVTGTITAVVAAEDYESAYDFAREAIEQSVDEGDFEANVSAGPIESVAALPDGWNDQCIPFGDGDGNTRIGKFFK